MKKLDDERLNNDEEEINEEMDNLDEAIEREIEKLRNNPNVSKEELVLLNELVNKTNKKKNSIMGAQLIAGIIKAFRRFIISFISLIIAYVVFMKSIDASWKNVLIFIGAISIFQAIYKAIASKMVKTEIGMLCADIFGFAVCIITTKVFANLNLFIVFSRLGVIIGFFIIAYIINYAIHYYLFRRKIKRYVGRL